MSNEQRFDTDLVVLEMDDRVHALLTLKTPATEAQVRPHLHLALVIDRSGSMAGEKLEAAKRCAAYLVEQLAPTDTLALVDFDDQVRLLCPAGPVDRQALRAAIDSIDAGGSTNLSGGWLKGREELLRVAGEGVRRILLLTDGQANVGITDSGQLEGLAGTTRGEGVTTTTIGFGEGFDEKLLTAMAEAGGGRGYFAETPDEAPSIFAEEFEGLSSLFAQNLSVEIRPEPVASRLEVLNDYPAVGMAGGVQVQIGDVLANEERRLLFRLLVPEVADLGPVKVAELVVRYVTVGENVEARELRMPVLANVVSAAEAAAAGLDRRVREEVAVLTAARARREARRLADEGRTREAAQRLQAASARMEDLVSGSERREELLADIEEIGRTASSLEQDEWSALDSKRLHYESRSRGTGRAPRSARRRRKKDPESDPTLGEDDDVTP